MSLAVVLGALEAGLRLFDPVGLSYFAEVRRYFDSMQPDDRYAYIHRSGMRARLQGVDVAINSAGFRGPEVEAANPQKKTRVLVLGDSVVFGWGAPQDAIFPTVLQRMLARRTPDVEVIAAGVGSWNTRTEFEYLRSAGVRFAPEVIVLLVTGNDLEPRRGARSDVARSRLFPGDEAGGGDGTPWVSSFWRAVVVRSHLAAYVQYIRSRRASGRQMSQSIEESAQWEDARLALNGIVRLSREKGATLLVFLYGSSEGVERDPVLRLYRDHLEKSGVDHAALPRELFADRRFWTSSVDSHPNSGGHAIIARAIHDHLIPVLTRLEARKR